MTFARAQAIAIIFLCLYAGIGFTAHLAAREAEDVYPFFSWFLFVTVPQRSQSSFDIRIIAVDGKELDPPQLLFQNAEAFMRPDPAKRDMLALALAQALGRALRQENQIEIERFREQLASRFIIPVTYEVREIGYDPIEYFKSKSVATSTILGTFTTGKP